MSKEKRDPHALYCDDVSLTKQSFKDECDINNIIARARDGGDISHINTRVGTYGDFTNVPSYRDALDFVREADEMFLGLDPNVRARFRNDPQELLSFLADDKNREEAVKLGILPPPEAKDASPKAKAPEKAPEGSKA